MEKSKARWATNVIFFVIPLILLFASASCIDDKCAACNVVDEKLVIGLSNEKPRSHLDLRNRLNSKGQREGKVIDYRGIILICRRVKKKVGIAFEFNYKCKISRATTSDIPGRVRNDYKGRKLTIGR